VFPSLGMWSSSFRTAEALREAIRVSNDWAFETLERFSPRLVTTGQVSTLNVGDAVRELERIAEMGYRAVYLPVQPHPLQKDYNRDDWEPFSAEQAKASAGKWDMDGPLIDYAAKGTKIESAGVEKIEGHDCYKLKLTLKNADVQYVWIDTQSFLDVKVSGTPRRMDGRMHNVYIYQRDFKTVQGLVLPQVLETAVDGYRDTHKMVIESLVINPKLDDSLFKKPQSK